MSGTAVYFWVYFALVIPVLLYELISGSPLGSLQVFGVIGVAVIVAVMAAKQLGSDASSKSEPPSSESPDEWPS